MEVTVKIPEGEYCDGCKFVGCEISANYFDISAKRISDEIASHSE